MKRKKLKDSLRGLELTARANYRIPMLAAEVLTLNSPLQLSSTPYQLVAEAKEALRAQVVWLRGL